MPTLTLDLCDEQHTVPARYEVCPRCAGHGTHDHPAFSNGISDAEFAEDEDFHEAYHSGAYDVSCQECLGQRVVLMPDRDSIPVKILQLMDEHDRSIHEMNATYAAERRMGA